MVWLLVLAPLGAAGCNDFNLASVWRDREVKVDGFDHEWGSVPGLQAEGVTVKAMNDESTLYLLLSADSGWAKRQLLGAFHQDLLIWFAPEGSPKATRGLKASLVPSPFWGFPQSLREEKPYLAAASQQLSFLKPGAADYPRPLAEESREAAFAVGDELGQVVWELAVALRSGDPAVFSLDAQPGQRLLFGLQATPIHALDGQGAPAFHAGRRRQAADQGLGGPQAVEIWGSLALARRP
jgi:hypothetical protein